MPDDSLDALRAESRRLIALPISWPLLVKVGAASALMSAAVILTPTYAGLLGLAAKVGVGAAELEGHRGAAGATSDDADVDGVERHQQPFPPPHIAEWMCFTPS